MGPKKILIPRSDHDSRILEQFQGKDYELEFYPGTDICPREEFLKRIKGKDAAFIVHNGKTIDKEVMDVAGPQLKVIGTMSVG